MRMFILGQRARSASMLASVIWIQCETWTSLIDCLHFPVVSCIIPLSVTFVLEMLRLWRNLQFLARTCSEVSVILMHPHKLRCSKCLQFSVKVIIAVSDTLMQRRRYTVWSWQQEVKTLMTPSEVMSSLEFLVAFKSSFLKFLQTQSEARPLSDILHSHNSKSLKDGCNTYRE